ncbi:MAG: PD40 domain-containing protein [Anaerolineae bacterium]|nr:PD40 domain-containing protein [Anaerolineae bacterium]
MPKHLAPLLLGLVSIALVAQTSLPPTPTSTAQQAANLKGCADLGLSTQPVTDANGWRYSVPSPDGTYVALEHHLGSHVGCYTVNVFQCTTQQVSPTMGCEGISDDTGSQVFANEWTSDHDLLISKDGKTESVDVRNYFTGLNTAKAYDEVVGSSPDGAWQIVNSGRDGMSELYRQRPDGSDAQRLTHSLALDNYFGWSADGQWIIFESYNSYDSFQPMKMRLDGSEQQPILTEAESELSQDHAWETLGLSPDHKWLLLQGLIPDPESTTGGLNYVLYRLGVPAGGLTRLTDPAVAYWFQDWTPDGRALVWHWRGSRPQRMFHLIDMDTAKSNVFFLGHEAEFKGWTDDHKAALFMVHSETNAALFWYRDELDSSGSTLIQPPTS